MSVGLMQSGSSIAWWQWVGFIVVVGFSVILSVALILDWQRKQRQRLVYLKIANRGNVPASYALSAAPMSSFIFRFFWEDQPLPQVDVREDGGAVSHAAASGAASPSASPQVAIPRVGDIGQGPLAAPLIRLGALLKIPLGKTFSQTGASVRLGQKWATQAQRLTGALPATSTAVPTTGTGAPPATAAAAPPAEGGESRVETPYVAPGDEVVLTVRLEPWNPYRTATHALHLASWPLEQPAPTVETETYTIAIEGLTFLELYVPFLLVLGGVLIALVLFLARWGNIL